MKGIPVLPNGDPVRKTFVIAGDFSQFGNWCRFSRVNPRSRNVKYLSDSYQLQGHRDVDVVFTGTDYTVRGLSDVLRYMEATGEVNYFDQLESCEIEPNIIEDTLVCTEDEHVDGCPYTL